MRLHERVQVVQRAATEMTTALDEIFGVGWEIERACMVVATVEIMCLAHSAEDASIPAAPPPDASYVGQLWRAVARIVEAHGLTWGEAARIVHHLSDSWLNLIVRIERHGDREDARADLAYEEGF